MGLNPPAFWNHIRYIINKSYMLTKGGRGSTPLQKSLGSVFFLALELKYIGGGGGILF